MIEAKKKFPRTLKEQLDGLTGKMIGIWVVSNGEQWYDGTLLYVGDDFIVVLNNDDGERGMQPNSIAIQHIVAMRVTRDSTNEADEASG